ncbi:MAG: type II toxin-antitoxin system Phd/YefM family antitoxin [Burkholderiales bacterium]
MMVSYSVANTKDHLSALIDRARAGEDVVITRRGKPAARIVAAESTACKDVAAATRHLREWRKAQAPVKIAIPYDRFYEWLYEDRED